MRSVSGSAVVLLTLVLAPVLERSAGAQAPGAAAKTMTPERLNQLTKNAPRGRLLDLAGQPTKWSISL